MDLQEMHAAWAAREQRFESWENKLFDAAFTLRDDLIAKLKSDPMAYTDLEGRSRWWVGAYEVDASTSPLERGSSTSRQFLAEGLLRFSIGVAMEIRPRTFPKTLITVPVAVRAHDGAIFWCLWDSEAHDADREQAWMPAAAMVTKLVTARIEMMLAWDPMKGPEDKRAIGFC